ncbi:MAG: sulfatase-like hydrolase/transferase [Planctomycetota bacterium]|nr:sulfatase-like hydrolase/transferase [Planctomycetota bacterium]
MIVVDDLGYGDLSSYGAKDLVSPNIDKLLNSGMRFTKAYANCPVCSPTRASIMTGRYPELVGVPGVIRTRKEESWGYLAPDCVLLPKLLKTANYHTAAICKWHLGLEAPNRPTDRGFDLFHGFLGDMMDDYYHHRRHNINYMRKNELEINPQGHATDLFTQWAQDYIQTRQKRGQPFFLYLAYNAPHTPIQPPPAWLRKIKQREKGITESRARLVALIEHLDEGIGRVLESLEKTGFEQETVVIFVSDNGGQVNVGGQNGALRDGKQSMYEGGIRVPFSIKWNSRIQAGSVSDEKVMTMDLLPTVCEVAGIVAPKEVDGKSLLKLATGEEERLAPRDLFFHRREGGTRYGGMITNAMIRGDWKLVRNTPFTPIELFDLKKDPGETVDLSEKNPKKFRELSGALRQQIQRAGAVTWQKSEKLKQ